MMQCRELEFLMLDPSSLPPVKRAIIEKKQAEIMSRYPDSRDISLHDTPPSEGNGGLKLCDSASSHWSIEAFTNGFVPYSPVVPLFAYFSAMYRHIALDSAISTNSMSVLSSCIN
ncbi:hypothetical protein Tco_1321987 [Tanacetum coccineum]